RAPVPGDMVEVVGRGIRGELVEIVGERARIRRGGLKFEVAADQLRVVEGPPPRERVAVAVERPADVPGEINLIGRRAREAVDALGEYLDRALRAGLAEVRVVHGLGTGALRRAVHDFLATLPYCTNYREAEPGAGGAGVTTTRPRALRAGPVPGGGGGGFRRPPPPLPRRPRAPRPRHPAPPPPPPRAAGRPPPLVPLARTGGGHRTLMGGADD